MIAIVAIDQQYGIGREGQLLQPISADLKRFKNITMGKVLIYGSKTLFTFPKARPLPGRLNLVLSRKLNTDDVAPAEVYSSRDTLLERVEELKAEGKTEEDFCIIGGASVYRDFVNLYHKVYLTRIDAAYEADSYFPRLDEHGFEATEVGNWLEEKGVRFRYETWEKKSVE